MRSCNLLCMQQNVKEFVCESLKHQAWPQHAAAAPHTPGGSPAPQTPRQHGPSGPEPQG